MSHNHYKTSEVRDLAWACFSPSLFHSEQLSDDSRNIANCALQLTLRRQQWLQALDRDPSALHTHLKGLHSTRLGLYFESLWHFFLSEDPAIELVVHNLPVRHQGKTLGEFDCLYFCRERQRHIHLELAVKYYLSCRKTTSTQAASHANEWLGPTNTDHLERKINHLTQRQIQLGDHPAARESLEKLGIEALVKEVEIKGYLFQSLSDPLPAPHAYNGQNALCRWLTIRELEAYIDSLDESRYRVLAKPQWLAPAVIEALSDDLWDREQLIRVLAEHFAQHGRPQLIAAFDQSGCECRRFFVTEPPWPPGTQP